MSVYVSMHGAPMILGKQIGSKIRLYLTFGADRRRSKRRVVLVDDTVSLDVLT